MVRQPEQGDTWREKDNPDKKAKITAVYEWVPLVEVTDSDGSARMPVSDLKTYYEPDNS